MSELPKPNLDQQGHTSEAHRERDVYVEKVRGFLSQAQIGSPELIFVSDLAESFNADAYADPTRRGQEQEIRKAVIRRDIENHEVMIPGYTQARKTFSKLITGNDDAHKYEHEEELARIEGEIAGSLHPDPEKTGSLEEVSDTADLAVAETLRALVDERLDQIDSKL